MNVNHLFEDGKPYFSLNNYYHQLFGEKVYKLAIDGGFTCPNRDGTCGNRGCIFCSGLGSGDFTSGRQLSITAQIESEKSRIAQKYSGNKYVAYFQSFTNTYAPPSILKKRYDEALSHPDIAALSIATRPDCLSPDVVKLLRECADQKPVFVELGLQTIHASTAAFIRRGYELPIFDEAVSLLQENDIPVIVHVILGLPGEHKADMLRTIAYLNQIGINGVKLQLLHILKGTDLAVYYHKSPFPLLTMEEYIDTVVCCIERLSPDIVIHRITGDGPRNQLIAPLWSLRKRDVLNKIHQEFRIRNTWQGKEI